MLLMVETLMLVMVESLMLLMVESMMLLMVESMKLLLVEQEVAAQQPATGQERLSTRQKEEKGK